MQFTIDQSNFEDYFLRNRWVRWLCGWVLLMIFFRIGYLQLFRGDQLYEFSQNNQLRREFMPAQRGLIYDRHGKILADHNIRFDVIWISQYIQDREKTIQFLSPYLEMTPDQIEDTLRKYRNFPRFLPVTLARNVSDDVVAAIETHKKFYDGIDLRMEPLRYYPYKDRLAHVLGYVSQVNQAELKQTPLTHQKYRSGDLIGKKGLERAMESPLRGTPGVSVTHVDAHGHRLEGGYGVSSLWSKVENRDPVQGKHLKTTLDLDIQEKLFSAFEGHPGAGVVLEVHTGKILAMVSLPSYDPNNIGENFSDILKQPEHPLFNKGIQGTFPPGSTFKIIVALAGLEYGLVQPDEHVGCSGAYQFGNKKYHCWQKTGHGVVNLTRAIIESCDVYFYHLAQRIGVERLAQFSKSLGFGEVSGIELHYERPGVVPTPDWKKDRYKQLWQEGETLSFAIGQGFLSVTPLQLAVAYAAVLNGGKVYRPTLVSEILDHHGVPLTVVEPTLVRDVGLNPKYVEWIQQAMAGVVGTPQGTGYAYRSRNIQFGGKTGTAQVRRFRQEQLYEKCEALPFDERHHGLFVGFWPVDQPKVVVVVVREHGCHGSSSAVPVARAVLEKLSQVYGDPSKKMAEGSP